MVNFSEYMHVTYKQISDMKHAIGFENRRVTGRIHRKYVPYRNYFALSHADPDWEDLCKLGFASKESLLTSVMYYVTPDGFIFLERVLGVQIVPEERKVKNAAD